MTDVFTRAKRSAVMARIRGAGNKDTELRLIDLMRAAEIRGWRRGTILRVEVQSRKFRKSKTDPRQAHRSVSSVHSVVQFRSLRILPDFVFRKQRLAIFVDGCFWHCCPIHSTWPKNNAAFWRTKIEGNRARDRMQTRLLRAHGWRVLRIREHALTTKKAGRTIARLQRARRHCVSKSESDPILDPIHRAEAQRR